MYYNKFYSKGHRETRFEEDGLDVSKKEVIFEVEKVLQKERAQKTMNSKAGRLLLGTYH